MHPPETHLGLAAIARLQRLRAALAACEAPDREDAMWLVGCFDRYFSEAAAGVNLAAVLGLTPTPGVVARWRARQQAERDCLLRQAAERRVHALVFVGDDGWRGS
jgi:hypothetical protein